MLENIRQISNPLFRAITSGFFLGSLVTIPATSTLLLINPKNESASKLIIYAALVSATVGVVGGLTTGMSKSINSKPQEAMGNEQSLAKSPEWKDWRKFIVIRKVKESNEITSFYLQPQDLGSISNFIPGQFLTIQLNIPEQPKPVIRTYSLSDYTESPTYYRLSIKREPAPTDTIAPPGIASNFMHDLIQEGSEILAKPPSGKFSLDVKHSHPVVLISNGVGITPMIAMVKAVSILNPARHIWFLHGARDGSVHAFVDEVNAIAATNPNLHVIYCYSRPTENDKDRYQYNGYVDVALIKDIVAPEIMKKLYGSTEAEYYLCGSPAFMDSLRTGLRAWGGPDHKVLFESFTKPMAKSQAALPEVISPNGEERNSREIIFSKSGKTLNWSPEDGTILEFAEANDIYPDNSCRAGICGTCMCRISEGEVEYLESPTASIDQGSVLICISKPKTARVVLDI